MGGAADALGGFLGAQSGNSAANTQNYKLNLGTSSLWNKLYGPTFDVQTGDLLPGKSWDSINNKTYGPNGGGLFDQLDANTRQTQQMGQGVMDRYNAGASGIKNMAQGAEGIARQFGKGANALIDEQSARDLRGANRSSLGQLAQSGLSNSTLAANQLSGNALNSSLGNRAQKIGVQNQMTDKLLGARQNNISTNQQLLGGQADIGRGLTDLFNSTNSNNLNTKLNTFSGGVFNPWLTNQPMQQQNPWGNVFSSAAGSIGAGGGGLKGLMGLFGL